MNETTTGKAGKPLVYLTFGNPLAAPAVALDLRLNYIFDWEAQYIEAHLRQTDRAWCAAALFNETVAHGIIDTAKRSTLLFVARVRGAVDKRPWTPVAVGGVTRFEDEPAHGYPWMLGTTDLERMPLQVYRSAIWFTKQCKQNFEYLENHTLAANTRECAMLERLGFDVEDPAPWGFAGKLFRRFRWSRGDVS
jgi:hypothetical protein